MTPVDRKARARVRAFNYSYVVLAILSLITIGATLVYYQNSAVFEDVTGARWTPVVFLIGVCVSLLIFGMTHRETTALRALQTKAQDLLAAQEENRELLKRNKGHGSWPSKQIARKTSSSPSSRTNSTHPSMLLPAESDPQNGGHFG
jgi:NADH:ubiquinone oxidoreductase subunit D